MTSYAGKEGVWCLFDYDATSYIISVHPDVTEAARAEARQGFGHVLFWPFGMAREEAIDWWKGPIVTEHFLLENSKTPLCQTIPSEEHLLEEVTKTVTCIECVGIVRDMFGVKK